jgi:hypothetical protein
MSPTHTPEIHDRVRRAGKAVSMELGVSVQILPAEACLTIQYPETVVQDVGECGFS